MSSHQILARADALMHRRKAPGEHEDVPILTDIVESLPVSAASPDIQELVITADVPETTEVPSPAASLTPEQHAEISRLVSQRLQAHLETILPGLIATALDEVTGTPRFSPPAA